MPPDSGLTKKGTTIETIADGDPNKLNRGLAQAAILKVSESGLININDPAGYFLLNPNSIEEDKSSNWNLQNVPGQSDPILQWSSSGPRTINFEALVTRDSSYFGLKTYYKENSEQQTLNMVGDLAAGFFKITLPPSTRGEPAGYSGYHNLDISEYLNYYRSLLYPEYGKDFNVRTKTITKSPPLVVLYMGRSINRETIGPKINENSDVWVVTDLKIKITKQLINLAPMEATVQFSLVQYNIRSFDSRRFLHKLY